MRLVSVLLENGSDERLEGHVAKKSSRSKSGGQSRSKSTKRDRISPKADTRYVKRGPRGQFSESDDAGRSQRADRRTRAKKTVKSGYGDQGDQKRRSRKR